MQSKRALLIGINAYAHVPSLDGCTNDVALMRGVLADVFGFPQEQMTTLLNEQATREGILAAFDTLIANTGKDDLVVIHYAGHGSQMTDREGDEPSGFDSTLVPVDSGRTPNDNRDITDDEIHLKLVALGKKTSFTTLIVDACHSGTITRDAFGAKARAIEPDRRPVADLPPSPIPGGHLPRTRSASSGWLPLADKYVLIAGCRDEERSYEYRPPEGEGAVAHGALTYFLCQQLRQATSGTSYRDVFEQASARVSAQNGEQHPQMEGRADREVFGVAELTPMTFLLVTGRQGDTVTIAGGAAHGLTVGSIYAVFPPGTKDSSAPPEGTATVTAVHALTSDARVSGETTPGVIGSHFRAFETEHAYGNFRLAVHLDSAPEADSHAAALRAAIEQSPRLSVTPDATAAAARVYCLPARTDVSSKSPVPQAGALGEPRWAVVGQTGDLLMPLNRLGDEHTVVENLETVAKYRQVLATENPDPQSRLRGRFQLELLRRSADGSWTVAEPEPDGGQVAFDEGDKMAIRVTSRHDTPAYVSLVDFGLSGAVQVARQEESLRAGGSYLIEGDLSFPAGAPFPFVDTVDHLREAEGVETLKLFVTAKPTDFTAIEQPGVRSVGAPASALAALLRGALNGTGTREFTAAPVRGDDWTTVSRSFVLRRRTTAPLAEGASVTLGTATLSSSGIAGTVAVDFGKAARAQSAQALTADLQRAFDASGIATRQTFELSNARSVPSTTRAAAEAPGLTLELATPPEGFGQMVMAVDELGVISWCLPGEAGSVTRSAEGTPSRRRYVIPGDVSAEATPEARTRGLIDVVGRKVLKELIFPLIDPLLGEVGALFVNRAEQALTPYRVRTFTPDDYALGDARSVERADWARLARGRALLMVHGTLSRTHMAFHQLPKDYVEALTRLYDGRIFAFDHFTLSHDPHENIRHLISFLPDDIDLTLDIVSHSRGGLVSRVLNERQGELSLGARRIRVGKVVLVGVPSAGTALAAPDNWTQAFGVLTNLINWLPDNGATEGVTLALSALKQLAVGAVSGLDGLQSMQPGGAFTQWLNAGDRAGDARYFAVGSNVTPVDAGFRRLVVRYGLNQLFGGGNDYVVPSDGIFTANGSGYFPISDRLILEREGAVAHTRYFADAAVRQHIQEWLSA
jgi:hypothetical protein